uniref:Uncharacterized protein n=1 Tax=Myotis myotis TaxID=51298 RepID=A0A7J7RCU7_MYOMY|nr:hypothetical protein mMyoMyo1_010818 [Myotis myotis]
MWQPHSNLPAPTCCSPAHPGVEEPGAAQRVEWAQVTFPPEQQAPTTANLGCDLAQQCRSCSRPVVTITSKKAKLQTCEPASPHPYHPSWWNLVWRHLRWQPLVTKRQHWGLTGLEPNSPSQDGTETEETQTRRGHQTPWQATLPRGPRSQ